VSLRPQSIHSEIGEGGEGKGGRGRIAGAKVRRRKGGTHIPAGYSFCWLLCKEGGGKREQSAELQKKRKIGKLNPSIDLGREEKKKKKRKKKPALGGERNRGCKFHSMGGAEKEEGLSPIY